MQLMTPETRSDEAYQRIAACGESRSHSLYLKNLGLTEITDELVSLTGLTALNLDGNSVGNGGARAIAERLSGLTTPRPSRSGRNPACGVTPDHT
jgi:hypothetical protein